MGKLEYFRITLENKPCNQEIYIPGEQLSGTLSFRVLERFKINSVRMIVDGTGRVKWTEGTGQNRRVYFANENYLNYKVVFLDKNDKNRQTNSGSDLFLEPGDYSYPFSFTLPTNLPTSFEHFYGHVRYTINGTIDIPWAIDKHTTKAFSIVNTFDLNKLVNLRQPVEVTDSKTLCCGPCKSGPITGEFTIRKTGFVPGETIISHASVDNRSRREIKPMTVRLVQEITFHGQRFTYHIKKVKREVAMVRYTNTIAARTHEDWSQIKLLIPPVCSTTDTSQPHIIEIAYELVFNFDAAGAHVSRDLSIPIVIGTVPLVDSSSQQDNTVSVVDPSSIQTHSYMPSVFEPNDSDHLPLEYDDIIGDIIESNAKSFKPLYPYFDSLYS